METTNKIVIIGCGAGGSTAAQFARKTDRKAKITIFEKGKYAQYSKCGLPYAISKKIPKFLDLIEFSKDWFEKEHIKLYLEAKVEKIDLKNKKIIAHNDGGEIAEKFDKLIIATGSKPIIPPINDLKKDNGLIKGIFVLRTIEDAENIVRFAKNKKNATIIGAGLIGMEMSEALYELGLNVTIVEALPFVLANSLDEDMSNLVLRNIPNEIKIYTNHLAKHINQKQGQIQSVHIKNVLDGNEQDVKTDIMIISAGTKPNIDTAKDIGCKIGKKGGIMVNEKSETNIKNVFAVGDCTEYKDFITNDTFLIGLGSIVVRQGIAAGINASNGSYKLPKGFLSTRTSKFFGIEIAAVGPVKNCFNTNNIIYGKIKSLSLPDYFPGGKDITIKVGVNKDSEKIVSAQAIGENAALRINTLASAIFSETKIETFRKLETAYAPPVAPTLDATTLACDVASLKISRKKR